MVPPENTKENLMTNETTLKPAASKLPSHIVYHVREGAGSDSFWTRVASAWAHGAGRKARPSLEMRCLKSSE